MPSGRGVAVLFAGLSRWLAARIIGSPGLEVVALGLAALPAIAALFVRWGQQRIAIHRSLSDVRVPPGTRVTVQIDVENRSSSATSFLLLEDRLQRIQSRWPQMQPHCAQWIPIVAQATYLESMYVISSTDWSGGSQLPHSIPPLRCSAW